MHLRDRHGSDRTSRSHAPTVLTLLVVCAAVAGFLWLLPETPTALRSAQPDLSAHVGRAPEEIQLDFGQAGVPGSMTTRVSVLGPDDEDFARGPAVPIADGIEQPVAQLPERGAYQVAYDVQLLDGSVASGHYWFWYSPTATGSTSRLESPLLLALLIALALALAAGLLAPGRRLVRPVRLPAQRAGSPLPTSARSGSHPVPAQRSRDRHEGISPPGSSPRTAAGATPAEPTRPAPPSSV